MAAITYMCPVCCRFEDKMAGHYDLSAAASCVCACPDCGGGLVPSDARWLDANGRELVADEITMPRWPLETTGD